VQGSGVRIEREVRVWGSGFRFQGFEFRGLISGLRVKSGASSGILSIYVVIFDARKRKKNIFSRIRLRCVPHRAPGSGFRVQG
jgi:hypothetical protein